jgi:hypothetical protein
MPEMKLDATDAAELAEMLQFLSHWLPATPAASAHRWKISSATPPTASRSCARTWSVLSSCSAAATVSPCSASRRHEPPGSPGQPTIRRARPGLNVVRPRAARCGRCALTPATAPALTGTSPGTPG